MTRRARIRESACSARLDRGLRDPDRTEWRGTSRVKDKQRRPWLSVIAGGESLVSHAGGALLVETARRSGLAKELSTGLGPWRRPFAIHDPGKIVLDMAVAVALGGDAACDVGVLRAQPGVFGLVASDPTVSRLIATLAEDPDGALAAITGARAVARERDARVPLAA